MHGESIAGVEFLCDWCGETARKKHSHLRNSKRNYCSDSCRASAHGARNLGENHPQWAGGNVTLECEHCGDEFEVVPVRADIAKYCSRQCSAKGRDFTGENHPCWNGGEVDIECETCGDAFSVTPSAADSRKYCSRECFAEVQRRRTGPECPAWRGGYNVYHALRDLGSETSWGTTRRRIKARDGYECQLCNTVIVEPRLQAHHIIPVFAGGTADDDLLMTLCIGCHNTVEAYMRSIPEVTPLVEYADSEDVELTPPGISSDD